MKNMMNKVSAKVNNLAVRGYVKGLQARDRVCDILRRTAG